MNSSSYKELNEFTPEFGTLVEGSVITLKRGNTVISDLTVPWSVDFSGLTSLTTIRGAAFANNKLTSVNFSENGELIVPAFTVPKTGFDVKGLRYTKLYELREKTPPTGYEISSKSVWFKIDYDGNLLDKRDRLFAGRSTLYFPNQLKGTISTVNLKKFDDKGALLSGAEFTLYKKNKDESYSELQKKVTDGSGTLSFSIPGGTYRLMETKAPLGFAKSNEAKEFTLPYFGDAKTLSFDMKNYKLQLNIQKIALVEKGIPYDKAENIVERLKAKNPDALYEITGDGTSGKYKIIKKLSGAKFQLKDASGIVIGEAESDIQGNVVFKNNGVLVPIKDGEDYTILETKAPKNYVISEKPFTFNTHDYSNLKDFNGKIDLSLENKRQESSITVVKRSLFSSRRLEGAKFQLSYARPGMNERIVYGEGFTNEEGTVVFERLNSDFSNVELVENTFFVKEMTPPKKFSNNGLEKVVRFKDPTDSELVTFYNTALNLSWYPNTGTLMGFGFAGLGSLAVLLSKRMKKKKKKVA